MNKENNPPAFPQAPIIKDGIVQGCTDLNFSGMTLRDYFAAKALLTNDSNGFDFETRAQWAYKMADAMILERNKETK